MNEGCVGTTQQVTFMEEQIKRTCGTSETIVVAINKLNTILIHLRGNLPPPLDGGEKRKEPIGNLDQLKEQLDIQVGLCNTLHNYIDELAKYF
jgi:hypothetical protein